MNNKKRWGIAGLALVLAAASLAGCGQGKTKGRQSVFTGDPNAIRMFRRENSTYEYALQEQFPDIKFEFYNYGGLNTTMAMNRLLEENDYGDICVNSLQVTDEVAKEHLIDLSGYTFCENYEPSILSQYDVDGRIYQVPGYVSMRNIIYNRDMFEEHGWKEPMNFGELVELCRQIREETDGITPIVMGGAATGYYFTVVTTYAQSEFLYKPEGRVWTENYLEGKGKAKDGFSSGVEMVQELIDAGAFDFEANMGLWDAALFEERMLTGEAAMMYEWGGQTDIGELMRANPDKHFGHMPFRNREGRAFIGTNIPYNIGLSKDLLKKGNEKKLENALRIMDWLTTEEGIRALAQDSLYAISPVKGSTDDMVYPRYKELWDENLDGIKAPMLYAGYEDILDTVAVAVMDAVQGKGSLDGLYDEIDKIHGKYIEQGDTAIEVGSFTKDFTHEQTVQTYANLLYEHGDSDLAMVSDGRWTDGVLNKNTVFLRFFEGPLIEDELTITVPGTSIVEPVEQLTLTGEQIRTLLEKGKHLVRYADDSRGLPIEADEKTVGEADFPYYYAGVTVEEKNGKVISVTKEDGTKLEDNEVYTVTCPPGDYTVAIAEVGNVTPLDYTVTEAFKEYLKANSPLDPDKVTGGRLGK